jgi:hypothetical protein
MTYGYIYKIQFPNCKHYIGLTTTSLEKRKNQHKSCAKKGLTNILYNSLRKYNIVDTFELIEIDTADTLEELCEKEILYIQEYNSYYMDGNGYNMTFGGEGTNGYIYTEDDRLRNSESQKKRFENPEEREKHSECQKKRFENPEEREKHCERMKKRFEDNPELGKEHSEKMKKRFEDNPELREKMDEYQKKYWGNPESKKKQSEIKKKWFEDNPELRKEHSERMKKIFEDNPKLRKEHSELMKKCWENPELKKKQLDTKGHNKPFDVFTTEGTFIQTFTYQFEAKEYLQKTYNIKSNIKIGEVLKGNRNSSAEFIFKYK